MRTTVQPSSYLTFEHDEFTMKPTLDETGRLVPRDDYRIATLNCGEEDFAVACMRANLRYGKNQKREDVKSHHYIISFDPRDAADNGLTVDRAQALGEKFCAEHFPGHQPLSAPTRTDTTTRGNIHVHIVINSLRIEEVPCCPTWTDRQIPVPGANIAARTLLWNTSKPRSWRCATGKISINRLLHGSKTALPSVSIGRRRKDKPNLTRKVPPLQPRGSLQSRPSLKPTRRSYGRPYGTP